ncbi:hypothetical protein CEXT_490771 [Caerostris extrusa]|uniref:Uncharacterized protein n=1 Tax=Caerostris extrusa TaxID=172846 RepID=A0AAV4XKI1_CAEEX|nr:hypothetical protein CEXT_490771 [Caerostris extrusa]
MFQESFAPLFFPDLWVGLAGRTFLDPWSTLFHLVQVPFLRVWRELFWHEFKVVELFVVVVSAPPVLGFCVLRDFMALHRIEFLQVMRVR